MSRFPFPQGTGPGQQPGFPGGAGGSFPSPGPGGAGNPGQANQTQDRIQQAAAVFRESTRFFRTAVEAYARVTARTEQFISSIAQNSAQVQSGQAQAELIKVRADLASDKIAGKALNEYIVQGAKTDAAIQQNMAYLAKWSSEMLTVVNKILQWLAEELLPILRAMDEWKSNWWDQYLASVKDFADTFRGILGESITAALIMWANNEEARIAKEKTIRGNPAIQNLFNEFVPISMNVPIAIPRGV